MAHALGPTATSRTPAAPARAPPRPGERGVTVWDVTTKKEQVVLSEAQHAIPAQAMPDTPTKNLEHSETRDLLQGAKQSADAMMTECKFVPATALDGLAANLATLLEWSTPAGNGPGCSAARQPRGCWHGGRCQSRSRDAGRDRVGLRRLHASQP